MYLFSDPLPAFDTLNEIYSAAKERLLARSTPQRSNLLIEIGSDSLTQGLKAGQSYLITEGLVEYRLFGRSLFFCESGDLLGLCETETELVPELGFEFALRVDEYDFRPSGKEATWLEDFVALQKAWGGLLLGAAATFCSEVVKESPKLKACEEGERIIEEGTQDDAVYTLVEGHAEVFVEGVKVGEILPDEIFGALAALAGAKRTATVIASQKSMILSLPKHNFIELLRWRPATVVKMMEDMARTIVSLNKKVVEQTKAQHKDKKDKAE